VIQISKILAPTDLSSLSLAAIRCALEIASERQGEVVVYHVIESKHDWFDEGDPLDPASALVPESKKRLRRLIEENFAEHLQRVKVTDAVECGVPYEKIVAAAEREGADLIVMSTHGRTGIEELIVGSVTAKVVARAGCPVLSIRPA